MMRRFMPVVTFMIMCALAACGDSQEEITARRREAVTKDTLRALRRIEAATQVQASLAQYNQLVIDARAQVNEAESILDLLQKWSKAKFKVVQPGDQVESQREPLSSIAIAFQQDAKDFQTANHILNHDPPP
jgi:hypothetical protein